MNREEKLNKATTLIQGLVPSIMELKKGTVFFYEKDTLGSATIEDIYEDGSVLIHDHYNDEDVKMSKEELLNEYTMPGREIHLEDVLKVCFEVKKDVIFRMTGDVEYKLGGYELHSWYNYDKPFTEQSEEFYDFIIKILEEN